LNVLLFFELLYNDSDFNSDFVTLNSPGTTMSFE